MKKLLQAVVATLIFSASAWQVFADKCPYCGREYGDYDPRDRNRFMALRAQHEANCPMNPANRSRHFNNYQNQQPDAPSGSSQWQLDQQRQADMERARRKAEEQLRRAEEERRQKFEHDKQDALNSLKGIGVREIQIKGGTALFGIKSNPDTVTLTSVGPAGAALPTAWKQLNGSAYLARAAVAAIQRNPTDIEEVKFLSDQAGKALNGERLSVVVPDTPAMPKRTSDPPPALREFYKIAIRVTKQQATRLQRADQMLHETEEKKRSVELEITTRQLSIDRLAEEIKTVEPEKKKEKENARAEALAALAKAREAEADANAEENAHEAEVKDAQDKLQEIGRFSRQAEIDPDSAPKLISQLPQLDKTQTSDANP